MITIVSGLPRSGTSLMMQMLDAGGLPVLSDGERKVDTPVNQSTPVVPGVRFVRPAVAPVILPRQVWEARRGVSSQAVDWKSADTLVRRDPHSFQDLLCTFLI